MKLNLRLNSLSVFFILFLFITLGFFITYKNFYYFTLLYFYPIVLILVYLLSKRNYIVFREYQNSLDEVEKALNLLGLKYKGQEGKFFVPKYYLKVDIGRFLGITTFSYSIGNEAEKNKARYIKNTIFKYVKYSVHSWKANSK